MIAVLRPPIDITGAATCNDEVGDSTRDADADVIVSGREPRRRTRRPGRLIRLLVVAQTAANQIREFELRLRFRFRLRTLAGKELIPDTEILQQRDISFNESAVLAKEAEEALLYRDMQSDVVQQIMRRLAAVTEL